MQNPNTEKTVEQIVEEFERDEGVQSAPVSGNQEVVNNVEEIISTETLPEEPKVEIVDDNNKIEIIDLTGDSDTNSQWGDKETRINESLVRLIVGFGSFGKCLFTNDFFNIADNLLVARHRGTLDPFITLKLLNNLLHGLCFGILIHHAERFLFRILMIPL